MKDVARLAGVSTSTVSHVVNNSRFVSDAIRQRVEEAVCQLNYAPSALARSLKVNRTQTLGMIVTATSNPFFSELIQEVELQCYSFGYQLIVCNTLGEASRLNEALSTLLVKRVDGILLMCTSIDDASLSVRDKLGQTPMVVLDWGESELECDKIQDNSLQGGLLATRHLIELGHRHIGCITGPLAHYQAKHRYLGYLQALQEAGISVTDDWIVESDFSCEGGKNALIALVKRTLAKQESLPTAICVANDMMAIGVLNACSELGIGVPDDLSVIGYDNISLSGYTVPALTTINQPKADLAKQAVSILLERIEPSSKMSNSAQSIFVSAETTVIIRQSTKAR